MNHKVESMIREVVAEDGQSVQHFLKKFFGGAGPESPDA
jgi:hypothetical protein